MSDSVRIYLAFRFHVNFYHSYRGDTPDELGFGKDIRIIRNTIQLLDWFNSTGVPVRGAWDIENYFSLEKIMPEHCPDIIESLKRRVAEGRDEVQPMSYNNGLISAHTPAEFDAAIARSISNAAGSGLRDVFGRFAPVVRPQEMMYTPIHLKMYPAHGVECISLFYSAVPFNAFSNFIRPLPFEHRYNPLMLMCPGVEETMTLLPTYEPGDVADNISLRWWVKRLRRKQMQMAEPNDLLLLIDADADDDFWAGYNWPIARQLLSAARGLRGLVESVRGLDYIVFSTPGEYIETHPPVGTVTIRQDTADGSFDGLSSWSEKWSNHQLWTGIERSRVLELQTRRLMKLAEDGGQVRELIEESFEDRLKSLSTTHFGLASPVVNVTRLSLGARLVEASVEKAARAFELAAASVLEKQAAEKDSVEFRLFDYVRGLSTESIQFHPKPSRALVRIPLSLPEPATAKISLLGPDGRPLPFAIRHPAGADTSADLELMFVETMEAGGQRTYRLSATDEPAADFFIEKPASAAAGVLQNEFISLRFDGLMQPVGFACSGIELSDTVFLRSAVNYAGEIVEATRWTLIESAMLANGLVAFTRLATEIPLGARTEYKAALEREFMLASGLPYLYVTTRVTYPETRSKNYSKKRARLFERSYDNNWREVMPCEIRPALFGRKGRRLRVWKHDYCDHAGYYDLDYAEFSKNTEIDSFNNHITHAWVALGDGEKGLLVAQTADLNSSFAFCPMRLRATVDGERVFMNPFGSYHGRQLNYVTAFTGLGKSIALRIADQLNPYAPSYNGRVETFSLMLAPYRGDEPPEEIRRDAEAFAYPYAVVSNSEIIAEPPHRRWSFAV